MSSAADAVRSAIRRSGPITFDRFMAEALYGPGGFFATGRGAGRAARDFVTSPQVGALFGALVARELDEQWVGLGRPDPFVVIEVGAGSGRLARDILRAEPACTAALRYVLVEGSPGLRAEQPQHVALDAPEVVLGPFAVEEPDEPPEPVLGTGPLVCSLDDLPARRVDGVVFANELLDNLPFGVAERTADGWCEVRVGLDGDEFTEVLVPCAAPPTFGIAVPVGVRVPIDRALTPWLQRAARCLRRGSVVLVDYVVAMADIVERSPHWLRTYAHHARGSEPLAYPGAYDITADVVSEHLVDAASRAGLVVVDDTSQADWLRSLGLDDLVSQARSTWEEQAHIGGLEALAARSRVHEAAALTDPEGLGAFRVVRLAAHR